MFNKKIMTFVLTGMMAFAAVGCGEATVPAASSKSANQMKGVSDVLNEGISEQADEETSKETAAVEATVAAITTVSADETGLTPDVNLTILPSTLVYSEVYNMTNTPNDYVGKVIQMRGTVGTFVDEVTGKPGYACIIADATSCCAQGIEFELTDTDITLNEGDEVEVIGTFDTYIEGEYMYSALRGASLLDLRKDA